MQRAKTLSQEESLSIIRKYFTNLNENIKNSPLSANGLQCVILFKIESIYWVFDYKNRKQLIEYKSIEFHESYDCCLKTNILTMVTICTG